MRTWFLRSMALLILVCIITSCRSPRQTSQALTSEILQQSPQSSEVKLLHSLEFENISETGRGTFFGVMGLYGSDVDYDDLFDYYVVFLTKQGWQTNSFGDYMRFCSPDYADVEIGLENVQGFEEHYRALLEGADPDTLKEYATLYVVRISHFPFDPQICVR